MDDHVKVNRSKRRITGVMNVLRFQDKDTNQYLAYCPSFDISSYGETKDKATEMLKASIDSFFSHLLSLSVKKMDEELRELGFLHVKDKTKEFSKAYVDINGEMQELNALNDEIEHLQLEAA